MPKGRGKGIRDLTGLKFGRLTVLSYSHKREGGGHYWNCLCDCGNEKKVLGACLLRERGFNKSCGCAKKEYNENRPDTFEDLTGQKFGRLTVTGFNRKEERKGNGDWPYHIYYWDCVCECGNKIVGISHCLRSGHTKSCGCYMMDRAKAQLKDLVGERSGKLVVERFSHICNECSYWLCKCDCGNGTVVRSDQIVNKTTKSCGCSRYDRKFNAKAGEKKSRKALFQTWAGMISRCYNIDDSAYNNYGGRGITVCERWRLSFQHFYDDMARPLEGYSLDRIDVNGNYEKDNCRWATVEEQNRNKRNNVNITIFNTTMCAAAWGDILGIKGGTVLKRIKTGWKDVEAVFTPPRKERGTGYIVRENEIINLNGVTLWKWN